MAKRAEIFAEETTVTIAATEATVVGQDYMVAFAVGASVGVPSGRVLVSDGQGSSCGPVFLAAGAGSCSLPSTEAGGFVLTATYIPDSSAFLASIGTGHHAVNRADTTLAIVDHAPQRSIPGQPVTLATALTVVAPGTGAPSGLVTLDDGIDGCTAAAGDSSCALILNTRGPRLVTARYAGDGNFGASSAEVWHAVNRLPIPAKATYATHASAPLTVIAAKGVLARASDPDGDALTIMNAGTLTAGGIGGTVVLHADGAFTYTPPKHAHGVATFDYTLGDGLETVTTTATITVAAAVDLAIRIGNDGDFVAGGAPVEYSIIVSNAGPGDAVGARVTNFLPWNLADAVWSCTASPGAACTPAGSGDIDDTVTIPSGARLTYRLIATVLADPETTVEQTVSVIAPEGVPDLDPTNNTATRRNTVGVFFDGFDRQELGR